MPIAGGSLYAAILQNGAYVRSWDTKMSVTAKTILEKHAELASMSRFQEASM